MIFQKKYYFSRVLLLIYSLWCLSLSNYCHCLLQAHGLVLQMLHVFIIFFITYFLMSIILKYIDIKIENNSSHLNDTI